LMDSSQSPLRFTYNRGVYWTVSNRTPELSIGYDESYACRVFEDSGFSTKIHYGGWCGRPPIFAKEFGLGDQDIVLATKQS
jgi:hypothetical protein